MFNKKKTKIDLTESSLKAFQLVQQLIDFISGGDKKTTIVFTTLSFLPENKGLKEYEIIMNVRNFCSSDTSVTLHSSLTLSKQDDPDWRDISGQPIKTWQLHDTIALRIDFIGFNGTIFFQKKDGQFVASATNDPADVELFMERIAVCKM